VDPAAVDPVLIAIVIGFVLLLVTGLLVVRRRRTTAAGQADPVQDHGDRSTAADLEVRPFPPGQRELLRGRFEHVQAAFVDDPSAAAERADGIIESAARVRGYPTDDRERLLALLGADHPSEVEAYREGLHRRQRTGRRRAGTEELRRSLLASRRLLEVMLRRGADDATTSTAFFRAMEEDARERQHRGSKGHR
jgi:hypothetical protein